MVLDPYYLYGGTYNISYSTCNGLDLLQMGHESKFMDYASVSLFYFLKTNEWSVFFPRQKVN